jgi:hypothetical protein
MYLRISKGHLGLHVVRGQTFHISAARQMSSRDEYRDLAGSRFKSKSAQSNATRDWITPVLGHAIMTAESMTKEISIEDLASI